MRAAVLMTPPYPLLLIAVPQSAIAGLVEGLRERAAPVTAVNGERESAAAFAVGWTSGTSLRDHRRAGTAIPPRAADRATAASVGRGSTRRGLRRRPRDEVARCVPTEDNTSDEAVGCVRWRVGGSPVSWSGSGRTTPNPSRWPDVRPPCQVSRGSDRSTHRSRAVVWLRNSGHGSVYAARQRDRRARRGPVHRPVEPDVERDLPGDRLPPGGGSDRAAVRLGGRDQDRAWPHA